MTRSRITIRIQASRWALAPGPRGDSVRGLTPTGSPARELGHAKHCSRMRRGLAPLEFVLWLPILLFIMALMVNYGTSAAWRVRGESVSRDAVWRTRWPRQAADEPPPDPAVWPANATMNVAQDTQIAALDIGALNVPVMRGPLQNGFVVKQLFDPKQGATKGTASIQRAFPFLPSVGSLNTGQITNSLMDGKWSNRTMGIPNYYRRIKVLYQLPWPDQTAYLNAVSQASGVSDSQALSIIDATYYDPNDDWWFYRNAGYQPWQGLPIRYHNMGKPYGQLIPLITNFCTTDVQQVQQTQVNKLVDVKQPNGQWKLGAISLVPRNLTNAYLGMFNSTKSRMQQLLNLMPTDPQYPSGPEQAFIQQQMQIVQGHINTLQQFQQQIPGWEKQMQNQ